MKSSWFVAGAAVALSVMCRNVAAQDGPEGLNKSDDVSVVVAGNNRFAFDLYAKLRDQDGNMFFSPYSVSTALAMTYAGARGATADEMARTLHFTLPPERLHPAFRRLIQSMNEGGRKGAFELSVANALWGKSGAGFLPAYLQLVERDYGAALRELNFAASEEARRTINEWVEKQTRDRIKELLKAGMITPQTELVLTNAIYFKGQWASKFKPDATKPEPFMLAGGKKIETPMMNCRGDYKYMEKPEFQMIELPYVGDRLSMLVLLPRKIAGMGEIEKSLTDNNLAKWLKELRKQEVIVALPKYKLTCEFGLNETLKAMGMRLAFGNADFSGMDGRGGLVISQVQHKAFVDVNEEGTEAAGATAVTMIRSSALPQPTPVFRADHPFIFLIRDNETGSVLFLGRLANPKG